MSALYYNAEKIGRGYVGTNLVYESAGPLFSFVPKEDMDGSYVVGSTCNEKFEEGSNITLNVSAKAGDTVVVKMIPELTEEYPYYTLDVSELSLQKFTSYKDATKMIRAFFDDADIVHLACAPLSCVDTFACSTAKQITIDSTKGVTDMCNMFYNCSRLTNLDVSNFDTSQVTDMSYMFSDCSSLTNVIFGPNWGSQKTYSSQMRLRLDNLSLDLTDETWASLLTIYDRQAAGYSTYTISLSEDHTPPSGWIDKMTVRGYTINMV